MALRYLETQRAVQPERADWSTPTTDLYDHKIWNQLLGMAMSMPQSQSLVMNEQLSRAFSTEVAREQEDIDWNPRNFAAAAGQQQHDQTGYQRHNLPNEPSTIALLQQKFALLERHKVEMQKANQAQQVQLYPSQWPMTNQPSHSLLQSQGASTTFAESRHYSSSNGSFYPLQQRQHQHVFPSGISDASEQYYTPKQELSWRPTQSAPTPVAPPNRTKSTPTAWAVGSSPQNGEAAANTFMFFKQQSQHQQPKVGDYQQNVRLRDVGAHQLASGSFQSSASIVPVLGHLSSTVASSRGDKTGGNSVKIKSLPEQYSSDNSEMSLDNFSGRVSTHVSQAPVPTVSHTTQVPLSSSFQLLPQSTKSAFSTFTRPGSQMGSPFEVEVTTQSLLFNDTYRRMQDQIELDYNDIDTTLHL